MHVRHYWRSVLPTVTLLCSLDQMAIMESTRTAVCVMQIRDGVNNYAWRKLCCRVHALASAGAGYIAPLLTGGHSATVVLKQLLPDEVF